jgi:4-methyl-5(b-hydroxyethyl)-thiazole monophosphate biosynthesis
MDMGKAYIFLADGFEETEALTTLDILRRGKIEAYTVSITEDIYVTSSHGITVVADMGRSDFSDIDIDEKDAMIFPGGMPGSKKLASDTPLIGLMNVHYEGGGLVAAICAAPGLVATQLKGIEGKKATCFDGFEENLAASGMEYVKAPTVTDGQLITGRGAAFAIGFGLAILEKMGGKEAVERVRTALLI